MRGHNDRLFHTVLAETSICWDAHVRMCEQTHTHTPVEKNFHIVRPIKAKLSLKVAGIYCVPCECCSVYWEEECHLLGSYTVRPLYELTFQRNVVPP
jgi:hypothetical protein